MLEVMSSSLNRESIITLRKRFIGLEIHVQGNDAASKMYFAPTACFFGFDFCAMA